MDLILIATGICILLTAGDVLVKASVACSVRLSVPPLIVGLTIVSLGTSLPELVVGIQAAWNGLGNLALGNILGSNIANILLVLGLPAMITAIKSDDRDLKTSLYFMIGSTLLFSFLVISGKLGVTHGIVLLIINFLIIFRTIRVAIFKAEKNSYIEVDGYNKVIPIWKLFFFFFFGFLGLPLGANLLIWGATGLATYWGVSEELIGLTIVAIGTSLPELTTAIITAMRKQIGLLLGNVVGSNLFNILGVAGASALFGNLSLQTEVKLTSVAMLIFSSIILIPFINFNIKINQIFGFIFVLIYVLYIVIII